MPYAGLKGAGGKGAGRKGAGGKGTGVIEVVGQSTSSMEPTSTNLDGRLKKWDRREPDTRLLWNADGMETEGRPDLNKYIPPEYREGWKLTI